MSFISPLWKPASATTDECHCPGEVAFTELVKTAWFKVKHQQTWELSTIGGKKDS